VRRHDLRRQIDRPRGRRGIAGLRRLLRDEPAFTRSDAEARLLQLLRGSDIPPFEVNARVFGYEVDFLWRREWLIVEVDGFAFHANRRAFEVDRLRDATLQGHGFRTMRVTWRQLVGEPAGVVRRIERAIGQGAR
jgi:very-short-patch-repair endonuclease